MLECKYLVVLCDFFILFFVRVNIVRFVVASVSCVFLNGNMYLCCCCFGSMYCGD